jgi:ankyrin repeat protein
MAETATVIEREGPKTLTEKLEEVLALIQEQKEDQVREILRTEKGLLHEACNSGSVDDVKLLLSRGVPLSDWNKSYLLPLHIAAIKNDITIAEVLLSHDPDIIDRPSKFGEVPLHFACMKGHLSMAKFLLKHKADIRTVDRCGNTVLHYAVSSNNPVLVEYLLECTNLNQFINKTNEFKQSPIHRAAVLQCVEVIRVLVAYRARLSSKDKNGLTALDLVTILYNNERMTDLSHKECIISPEAYDKFKAPSSSNMYINHIRSGSFSSQTRRSIQSSVIGSTASLPVSDGVQRKRPSATQSKRPVNLTISNSSYTRQASGNSNYSSRSSEIYLRDKDHAERISQVLDKQTSIDAVEKALLDQTSYDPPIDLNCILPIEKFTVSLSNLSCQSKEHDMRFSINDKYWLLDQSEMLEFKLAASLSWSDSYPSGFIFVSPICFLSCRSKRTCEVTLTLPHSLHFPSEKHHKRIIIFFTNTINLETGVTSPSCRDFQRLAVSDLKINSDYVTFTTSIRYPSLFVVGVASPPQTSKGTLSMIQYPVLPMRCCLYVACPSEREEYVTNTEISLYVGMSLKTVDAVRDFIHLYADSMYPLGYAEVLVTSFIYS